MKNALALLGAATLLSACVSVLPEAAPPAPRFGVSAGVAGAMEGPALGWTLSVDDPAATRAVDTTKIAVRSAPEQFEYYSGGEWADRAPLLIQASLVRSFQNTGRILGVGSRVSQPVADYILLSDLRDFSVDRTGGAPAAKIAVYAKLANLRGKPYAAKLFTRTVEMPADNARAAAKALNEAADEVVAEIVAWSFEQGEAARAGS